MTPRLLVLVVFAGCAPTFATVPESDWLSVPAAQRAAIDNTYAAQLAHAQGELRTASIAATAHAPRVARPAAAAKLAIAPGDDWANAMRTYEHNQAAARAQIDAAAAGYAAASAQYRRERVAMLTLEVDELRAAHELARARAIDHNLLGDDTYETAGYQGQLARFQAPRYAAQARVDAAQAALQHAGVQLATVKDTYATLVRRGPLAPTSSDSSLQLTAWHPTTPYERSHHEAPHYLNPPARIAGR